MVVLNDFADIKQAFNMAEFSQHFFPPIIDKVDKAPPSGGEQMKHNISKMMITM